MDPNVGRIAFELEKLNRRIDIENQKSDLIAEKLDLIAEKLEALTNAILMK